MASALPILSQPVPGRSCGTCNLCCKLPSVVLDDGSTKELNEWCKNCTPGANGCAIHETKPKACKDFICTWLGDSGWPEELSPKKTGCMVVTEVMLSESGEEKLVVRVHENKPHAVNSIQNILYRAFCTGVAITVYDNSGTIRSLIWDRHGKRHELIKLQASSGDNLIPTATWHDVVKLKKGNIAELQVEAAEAARDRELEIL